MAVQALILVLALASVGLSAYAIRRDTPLEWRFAPVETVAAKGAPEFRQVFDYQPETGHAHSPAIMQTEAGFRVLWFEGSAEAQADVDIHAVEIIAGQAGDIQPYITRGALTGAFRPTQLVVTLGNTIENGSGGLYATVVSLGGWAMAAIADVRMGGSGPAEARKLNLSPLLNRSNLVKSPMVTYADGSQALPLYFEMGTTWSGLARIVQGRVRDVVRMPTGGIKPIQPMIVPQDARRAVAFLRDFDKSGVMWLSRTADGGQSWSAPERTDIPNPSAPVAALAIGGGRILAAMNDTADERLRLVGSGDGGASWQELRLLEEGGAGARYPMLRRLENGEIALTYSFAGKRGIRAFVLNQAWVEAQWPKG